MHILVAGGAGFIGSHLSGALLADGHQVTIVDNYLTGNPRNIAAIRSHPRLRVVEHDVTAVLPGDLGPLDQIYDLASPASPADFSRIPLAIMRTNSLGAMNLLDLAVQQGARFLFTSTSEAYGDPLVHPQVETYWGNVNSVGPRACYDESKRFAEALLMTYVREAGLDGRLVRIFNTYGPHMNPQDGRVVPNFISQALSGPAITIYGDGRQTRAFCYVDDMVRGLRAVMDAPRAVACGRVYNVGNPDERYIVDFAQIIRDLIGSPVPIAHRPALAEDPSRRCPDISRIRGEIGWQPEVDLASGLARTIAWFRSVVAPPVAAAAAAREGLAARPER